jgi:glutamine amidotransferase
VIVVIDYGMGNLRSVLNKVKKASIQAILSSRVEDIESAERLILPGVGSFGAGMERLQTHGLIPVLQETVVIRKVPILGICLGMQLFAAWSEESNTKGLGWIDADVKKFNFPESMSNRIPHVGWNILIPKRNSPLLNNIQTGQRFYFTHSYHLFCRCDYDIVATTEYGYEFASVIHHKNIFGTQFHPEKSHRRGIEIIRNFDQYST